jgi:hypothetical protein
VSATRRAPLELPGAKLAAVAFAVVIIATALSFAFAQRLKREPPLAYDVQALELFSPTAPEAQHRARFSFYLRKPDTITIYITDKAGNPVRTIIRDLEVKNGKQVKASWNGANDRGKLVPDGEYRVQVVLQEAGRAIQLPKTLVKDTKAPEPKLLSIGPEKTGATPRPELIPRADGKPITVRYRAAGRSIGISVIRTDLARPRTVLEVPAAEGQTKWVWDGTVEGKKVSQGTYVVAIHAKDFVGNVGWSTGSAIPIPPFGGQLKGQGGVTVRYLAAQSPQAAVPAGKRAGIGVISAGKRYQWTIRKVGETKSRSRGESARPILRPKMPTGPSGLFVLETRIGGRTAQATVLTQAAAKQKVLVVVPQTSLVGEMLVDDNGDGSPDTLSRGVNVQTGRVPVSPELAPDMSEHIAPLLLALDRKDRRYDLTTDLALARDEGPTLKGHSGVILAGTASYVDGQLQKKLVTWVKRGGRLWIAEPESLRRSVKVTADAAVDPTQASRLDPFGFELGPLQQVTGVVQTGDRAKLLRGTDGRFDGSLTVEPILRTPTGGTVLAEATTPGGGQIVLAAVTVQRGVVIRSGISGLGANSLRDPDSREFVTRLWGFLRGGD